MKAFARARRYASSDLRGDAVAALATTTLALPQGMAYALLAGVPAQYGIYASIVPPLFYALVGRSAHLAVGPVALTALLVATGLEPLATPMTEAYLSLAVLTSLLVGASMIVLGLLRAGFVVNFLSQPAIVGFTGAAAILTAMSQVRGVAGIPRAALAGENTSAENPWPVLLHLQELRWPSLALGLVSLAILLFMSKKARKIPGALVVCALGGVFAWVAKLPADVLATVGDIPRGLPTFVLPDVSLSGMRAVLPTVITVTVVGYGTSIAVARAIAAKHRERVEPNRELLAIGLANLGGSFASCFPVSDSLGRSLVASRAGARTAVTGALGGLFVLAAAVGFAPAFGWLPIPVLGAIIIHAAMQLFDLGEARDVLRARRSDAITLLATFVVTLAVGLLEGLAVGLILAMVLLVVRSAIPHSAELGRIPGTFVYRNVRRFETEVCPQVGILRIDAPLHYANARFLDDRIARLFADRPDMKLLVLDCSGVGEIDATALQTLRNLVDALRGRGNDLHLVGAIGPVRDTLERTGIAELIGPSNMHRTIIEAAPVLMQRISRDFCRKECGVSAFPDCTLIARERLGTTRSEAARFSPQI
jgi:SulP family sulfate permease